MRPLSGPAVAGAVLAGLAIAMLHVVRPDVSPLHRFVSEYAVDVDGASSGWLMQAAFLLLAGCATMLAIAAFIVERASAPASGTSGRGGPLHYFQCLVLAGAAAGTLVMFACKTDLNVAPFTETAVGKAHDIASVITFLFALAAMFAAGKVWHTSHRFFVAGAVTLAIQFALMAAQHRPYLWVGITERVLIVILLSWCVGFARCRVSNSTPSS